MNATELVEKARALLAAATPGPWTEDTWFGEVDGNDGVVSVGPHHIDLHDPDLMPDEPGHSDYAYDRACADAALIAATPGLIAALCDEVYRLQFELGDALHGMKKAHDAMGSILSISGAMKHFIEHAAPMFSPDADGRVMAPNHVTSTLTHGPERYEFTIRKWDGKTPGDVIGELEAALSAAEKRADEVEAGAAALVDALTTTIVAHDTPVPAESWHAALDVFRNKSSAARAFLARLHAAEDERGLAIGQRDEARREVERLRAKVAQLEARTAGLCDCMATPFAENKGASDCPACNGSGAVIVEGAT